MSTWEEASHVLDSVAKSFPEDSAEFKAIEKAAWAYFFVNIHEDLKQKFEVFRTEGNKDLSDTQKKQLGNMGIEP